MIKEKKEWSQNGFRAGTNTIITAKNIKTGSEHHNEVAVNLLDSQNVSYFKNKFIISMLKITMYLKSKEIRKQIAGPQS